MVLHASKILLTVILGRIRVKAEEQVGFRTGWRSNPQLSITNEEVSHI